MGTRRDETKRQPEFLFVFQGNDAGKMSPVAPLRTADAPSSEHEREKILEKRRELIRQLEKFGI